MRKTACIWSPSFLKASVFIKHCSTFTPYHGSLLAATSPSLTLKVAPRLEAGCHLSCLSPCHWALPCNMSDKWHVHIMFTSAGPPGRFFGTSCTLMQLLGLERLCSTQVRRFARKTHRTQHVVVLMARIYSSERLQSHIRRGKCVYSKVQRNLGVLYLWSDIEHA